MGTRAEDYHPSATSSKSPESQTILVTGGAGYIGSVLTEMLIDHGYQVVIVDNLVTGYRASVHPQAEFIQGNIGDKEILNQVFLTHQIDTVMHLAFYPAVVDPNVPWNTFFLNVFYGANLLTAMMKYGVKNLIFSSSAAVYGEPSEMPIRDEAPFRPINFYGGAKAAFECLLYAFYKDHNLNSVSLRYFNAAGATKTYGENHVPETHLIPKLLMAAQGKMPFYQWGDDSCIRDYVHVSDIALAHLLSLKKEGCHAYNIGTDSGYSVKEVIEMARKVTGSPILYAGSNPPRQGDPPCLVASYAKAERELGWKPSYSLESIIQSAWDYLQS